MKGNLFKDTSEALHKGVSSGDYYSKVKELPEMYPFLSENYPFCNNTECTSTDKPCNVFNRCIHYEPVD